MHSGEQKLGVESVLVQAKLGHDLRPYLQDSFSEALPSRLQRLVDDLMGYVPYRVIEGGTGSSRPVVTGEVENWVQVDPVADPALAPLVGDQASDTLSFPTER